MVRKHLGRRGLWGTLFAGVALIGLASIVSSGCNKDKCEKPKVEVVGAPTPAYSEDGDIEGGGWVNQTDSVTRATCYPKRIANPDNPHVNTGLIVEINFAGQSAKNGSMASVEVWPADWDKLREATAVYCTVSTPESCVFEGPAWNPQLLYCIPEKVVYNYYIEVDVTCQEGGDDTYCASGYWDDGWHCTQWHKSRFGGDYECREVDGGQILRYSICGDFDFDAGECTDWNRISMTGAAIEEGACDSTLGDVEYEDTYDASDNESVRYQVNSEGFLDRI